MPDGVLELDCKLSGFPLGPSTRQVEIRSPQLAASQTITFEVVTALTPLAIPIVVILGLLLGYLVNTALPRITAWAERRRVPNTRLAEAQAMAVTSSTLIIGE